MTSQTTNNQQPPSAVAPENKSPPLVSPVRSREPSPARPLLSPPLLQPKDTRPRTNNDTLAPTRSPASGSSTPNDNVRNRPLSLNEAAMKLARAENQENGGSNSSALRWPTSPRIKSPPAANSRRNSSSSQRQSEGESAESEAVPPTGRPAQTSSEAGTKSPVTAPSAGKDVKAPRGFSGLTSTLETVQEGDHSSSPNNTENGTVGGAWPGLAEQVLDSKTRSTTSPERLVKEGTTDTLAGEADPTKNKDAVKSPVQLLPSGKKPGPSMSNSKVRSSNEGSSQNMTVETETVASIPHTSSNVNNTERNGATKKDDSGSIRANPSSEAVKPKKEKKKLVQKRPNAASGQASTKADIFEAKVTSAAEDDDSDSDETFIYESNPAEQKPRPSRHHSRTPSATSMRSLSERKTTARTLGNMTDSQRGVKAKRSMKFASSAFAADDDGNDNEYGTVRAHRQKNGSSSAHQHHRNGYSTQGAGEEESPYSQASKLRNVANLASPYPSSKARTPKSTSPPPYSRTPTKGDQASSFDFDQQRTFSEHDPLLGSLRAPRTRHGRDTNLRYIGYYDGQPENQRSFVRRCAGSCLVILIVFIVLLIAGGFLFATTHPLYDVDLLDIQSVLASDESLMCDLQVGAINPNIVPITIGDLDVNVFAKSSHVNSESRTSSRCAGYRRTGSTHESPHTLDSVDDGTDPITDPTTLLLGRVFHFDSALTFDASPFQHAAHNATGGLRIDKPANQTETDGTKRWERVIKFPFRLIVRGVLRYTLPLSSRVVTVSVGQSVHVDPDDDDSNGTIMGLRRFIVRPGEKFRSIEISQNTPLAANAGWTSRKRRKDGSTLDTGR